MRKKLLLYKVRFNVPAGNTQQPFTKLFVRRRTERGHSDCSSHASQNTLTINFIF